MKMKPFFLSMLAIAALASCTNENFNVDPPAPQEGEKMLVDITLSTGEKTKATGTPGPDEDKAINNVTVFFLNATDQIVSRTYVEGANLSDDTENPGVKKATVETRTTASKMMVIANIGDDRTPNGKPLYVSTRQQLEKVVQSLITTDNPPLPFQSKGDVLMSGEGEVSTMTSDPAGGNSTATAVVTLNYISAKITLAKIALGDNVKGAYGTDFKFTRAFLLNAQTDTHYFPTAGSYIPDSKVYANGAWEDAWGADPGYPIVPDFNQTLASIATSADLPKENIAHWYVFENNPASVDPSLKPTILAVEVEWTKIKGDEAAGVTEEKVKKMFNVIFAPGDKGVIEAGKAYNVVLTFNGDFRPENQGGNGGGGDDNPDKPNIAANVDITVTPAEWTDADASKPF